MPYKDFGWEVEKTLDDYFDALIDWTDVGIQRGKTVDTIIEHLDLHYSDLERCLMVAAVLTTDSTRLEQYLFDIVSDEYRNRKLVYDANKKGEE